MKMAIYEGQPYRTEEKLSWRNWLNFRLYRCDINARRWRKCWYSKWISKTRSVDRSVK